MIYLTSQLAWYWQKIVILMPSHFCAGSTGYQCVNVCCTRWLSWRGKLARPVSRRTSTSIWFHTSLFATHALLRYLCWLCQNLPRISLGVPLPTRHPLSGTVSRQTFYSVILTLFLGNIWKHFCSLPPDWLSSSASVALHMALYKWDYYYYYY